VGALEPKFYRELLEVLGLSGEIDPRAQYDRATWPATITRFAQVFAARTRDQWAEDAMQRDCCIAPVLNFLEAAAYAHNTDNGLYVDEPFAQVGRTIDFDRGLY
jgi:alpha-methylacyl-CoA racemase